MSLQEQTHQQKLPKTPESIAKKIADYYGELKERETLHGLIREVAEENLLDFFIENEMESELIDLKDQWEDGTITEEEYEEEKIKLRDTAKIRIDNTYVFEGLMLKYKKRTSWSWKKELDEELEDIGCLHLCKDVLKSSEARHNIAMFKLPNDKYIRIHNHLKESKEEKKDRKVAEEEALAENRKLLQLKSMEELMLLFKENKEELSKLEEMYQNDREELFEEMEKKNLSEVFGNEEETLSFKMLERTGGYDTKEIVQNNILKKFLFSFHFLDDGKVECKDWYTGETFSFLKETEHDGHTISIQDTTLFVDGQMLETPELENLFKKKDIKEIVAKKLFVSYGELEISGTDFLKTCKTSSTKVEKLVEEGKLKLSVYDQYRYVKDEKDMSLVFEVVEEESDVKRRTYFHKRLAIRNDRIRRNEEQQKELRKFYQI